MVHRTETMQLPWPHGPHAERSKRAISPEFVNGNSFCSVYSTSEHVPATHARSQIEEQLGAGRQKSFWTQNDNAWTVTPGFLVIRSTSNSYKQRFRKLRRAVVLTVVYNARDVETVSPNWPATSDTVLDRAKNRGSSGDANSRRAQLVACAVRTSDHIGQFVTPAQIVDALLMMWKLLGDTV